MAQEVEKYSKPVRILHWVHTGAFVFLFFTGLILFIPGLGVLAQDSHTRILHRLFALIFVAAPLLYAFMNPKGAIAGLKEALKWGKEDLEWLKAAPRYYFLGDESAMPPQGHMNTGQKMWWAMVIGLGGVLFITGLIRVLVIAFWPDANVAGLQQWAMFFHDLAFIGVGTMFFVHIYLSVAHPLMRPLKTGAWSAMARGKISVDYAKSHHGKWYKEVTKETGETS